MLFCLQGSDVVPLYQRIELLCQQRDISVYKLEKELHLARNTIKNWQTGAIPSGRMLLLVANYFNVSIDYLFGRTENQLSHNEPIPIAGTKILKKVQELQITEFESDVLIDVMETIVKGIRHDEKSL